MNNGIIVYATEEAKNKYKGKIKKTKKNSCPSCEIKLKKVVVSNYLDDIITEKDLED